MTDWPRPAGAVKIEMYLQEVQTCTSHAQPSFPPFLTQASSLSRDVARRDPRRDFPRDFRAVRPL